ncbi:3-methyl-2-oxobutanoate hydroxymethyltransferase [Halococcoides cellulosivorans]|uniref:3-methyl-2-oxobutanoate hydroxymethyltransferase n=1 Tax=Halococcoides cellulosivorans TaxID=1679096 RepID=A0A2R4WYU6_9EURY|nr:3-methyl-2-oxobutanoate hydroxymethyltransferase [Halococcoides cellulosivorans]AWB26713.1 3-methyl-2-oxobutanoate hydroxymethyltransferase [Halococcoides cellulosivorans]
MTTVREIRTWDADRPIAMLTAYDATTAALVERAGVDLILVGDSVANVRLGHDSTLPVDQAAMEHHVAAVARGVESVPVIADMPFLSIGADRGDSVEHCGRMLKEAGADAVKIESGPHTVDLTERLVQLGIPVMAHLGLTPQRVKELGGYRQQGQSDEDAAEIRDLAVAHADAGAFAVVLEHVPSDLAREVTERIDVPTIGIGAGPHTTGQVLVVDDAVGLSDEQPPFAEAFGDLRAEFEDALDGYVEAVQSGAFPPGED